MAVPNPGVVQALGAEWIWRACSDPTAIGAALGALFGAVETHCGLWIFDPRVNGMRSEDLLDS